MLKVLSYIYLHFEQKNKNNLIKFNLVLKNAKCYFYFRQI